MEGENVKAVLLKGGLWLTAVVLVGSTLIDIYQENVIKDAVELFTIPNVKNEVLSAAVNESDEFRAATQYQSDEWILKSLCCKSDINECLVTFKAIDGDDSLHLNRLKNPVGLTLSWSSSQPSVINSPDNISKQEASDIIERLSDLFFRL
ncbi:hypothetical protein [Photobacterium kishitanii]|uniref:Uncharacterized protein n=1 Tax=Photobacterium kishitanii TaxID=318456 RepID=A0A2T3KLU7_9GAMM|nr:hypothetical protein [Photobacterium kishitanii]PSV00653.1 hypothetical protein C9J27_05810 [Photobacterium kishitanii]